MNKLVSSELAKAFRRLLEHSRNVVLTCHVRPDGDAIGSTLGLWHLLRRMGIQTTVIVPDKPPVSISFLPGFKEIGVFTVHPEFCKKTIDESDLMICCDFNTPSRLDSLSPLVSASTCRKVLVDHHPEPADFTEIAFSHPDMSSTCELCFRIISAMGLFCEVDKECATCLLTGIVTDTRNLSVNCRHPDLYEIVMRLLEKGVDKEKIVREALNTKSYWALKLEAFAISERMKIYNQHKCCIIALGKDDLEAYHYERGDTEGLVNRPLEVKSVVYSVFMREDADCIKVSARSKDNFPVSEICKDLYGGGGHLQAAGGEFHGTLDDCRKLLVEAMPKYDKYLKE